MLHPAEEEKKNKRNAYGHYFDKNKYETSSGQSQGIWWTEHCISARIVFGIRGLEPRFVCSQATKKTFTPRKKQIAYAQFGFMNKKKRQIKHGHHSVSSIKP